MVAKIVRAARDRAFSVFHKGVEATRSTRVKLFVQLVRSLYFLRQSRRRYEHHIEMVCWLFLALTAVGIATPLQNWLTPHMANKTMESLQTLALTIGGAMIGATAIASSFVLFAMQVNVERLPYGLFHRFSSDVKLLSAFALSFVAAIAGAAFSLISNGGYAAILALLELGAVAGVLRLLLFAYRRSLHLVNPVQQLALIYRRADRDLQRIDRHIGWMLPRPQ